MSIQAILHTYRQVLQAGVFNVFLNLYNESTKLKKHEKKLCVNLFLFQLLITFSCFRYFVFS